MELISKDDVIKALQKWNCRDYDSLTINPYEVLRDIPIIEERKEGRWLWAGNDYKCPFCGEVFEDFYPYEGDPNFCPNCGEKLKSAER